MCLVSLLITKYEKMSLFKKTLSSRIFYATSNRVVNGVVYRLVHGVGLSVFNPPTVFRWRRNRKVGNCEARDGNITTPQNS